MSRKLQLPGSRFVDRGKIFIKIKVPNSFTEDGKPVYYKEATGLSDTKQGRDLAQERHLALYRQLYLGEGVKPQRLIRRADDVFAEFLESKPRMAKTVHGYKCAYNAIFEGNPFLTTEVASNAIRRYISDTSKSKDHNSTTVENYIRHISSFIGYCIDAHLVDADVKKVIKNRKKTHSDREDTVAGRFDDAEILAVLKACYAKDKEFGIFNEFMLLTGARPVDALTLEWKQVKQTSIVWQNKISKRPEERVISDKVIQLLSQLKFERAAEGKVFRWQYTTNSKLTRWFNDCIQAAGVAKVGADKRNRSMKSWRVIFRATLHELPLEMQRWLMRHKSLQVTSENYTFFTPKEQKDGLEKVQGNDV